MIKEIISIFFTENMALIQIKDDEFLLRLGDIQLYLTKRDLKKLLELISIKLK